MLEFSLDLINEAVAAKELERRLRTVVESRLQVAAPAVLEHARELFGQALREEPHYTSLLNGTLREELGLKNPAEEVELAIAAAVSAIKVASLPARGLSLGGLEVLLLGEAYQQAIAIGSYENDGKHKTQIPWLEWLLLAGDSIIIQDFHVLTALAKGVASFPASRSGTALMVPRGAWRIPPEFAGTADDNWFVRAARKVGPILLTTVRL